MVYPASQPAHAFGFERIRYEKSGWRATVTINRPEVHNCLDFQTLREMSRAFEDACPVEPRPQKPVLAHCAHRA